MTSKRICRWLPGLPGVATSPAFASDIAGDLATNAGSLLVILGVFAILLGVRNLRVLRHRPPTTRQPRREASGAPTNGV